MGRASPTQFLWLGKLSLILSHAENSSAPLCLLSPGSPSSRWLRRNSQSSEPPLWWRRLASAWTDQLCGRRWKCTGMTKRKHVSPEALDASLLPKQRKPIPHPFVLDAISTLSPYTRPMFGCLAIYVKDKIVLILRDKPKSAADNGVWLATTQEHHQSLRREFPNMRSIQVLGKRVTGWQVLPVDASDFESAALRACELVLAGDPRIGKIPGARTSKSGSKAAGRSSKQIKTS